MTGCLLKKRPIARTSGQDIHGIDIGGSRYLIGGNHVYNVYGNSGYGIAIYNNGPTGVSAVAFSSGDTGLVSERVSHCTQQGVCKTKN